jgi:hypothetical protein
MERYRRVSGGLKPQLRCYDRILEPHTSARGRKLTLHEYDRLQRAHRQHRRPPYYSPVDKPEHLHYGDIDRNGNC